MAIIDFYYQNDNHDWIHEKHKYDGLAYQWILDNISSDYNYKVYEGNPCDENEISRDLDKMKVATDVFVQILPSGAALVPIAIAVVVSVAVTQLVPIPSAPPNVNRAQQSPNNELSDRRNRIRRNQRVVDFVGKNPSVLDVVQREFSRFVNGVEERIGAYAVGRNQLDIERLRDGDSLIADIKGASAGIYYPFKSPNNSTPDVQIGEAINERVVGVHQSNNALGQTIKAPERIETFMTLATSHVAKMSTIFGRVTDTSLDFRQLFSAGDFVEFADLFAQTPEPTGLVDLSSSTGLEVAQVAEHYIDIRITGSTAWESLPVIGTQYKTASFDIPIVISPDSVDIDTYKITSVKVDRLLVNVFGQNGMYKRGIGDKQAVSVDFKFVYYLLDDDFNRIGSSRTFDGTLSGKTDDQIGTTIDIKLGGRFHVEWYLYRTSFTDKDFNGTVVDAIKLKDVFGLWDIPQDHFGNITMVQTKRKALQQVTAIRNPEVNCIATEMLYKYLGNGAFDTVLTKNTQAMQSLIAKCLDPKIGRMTVDELDLDLMLQQQEEIETYYGTSKAGECSYSFDSTNTTAEETISLICNAVSVIPWREGRVLKTWFERPQSLPEMVFTHRSKSTDLETWDRDFKLKHDGVEFKYSDSLTFEQEVLTHPAGALNPKTFEIPGIRGLELATWRMMREYNKMMWQRESVEFTALQEGRFVKPQKMISVVEDSRVGSFAGYIRAYNFPEIELSQAVEFTEGDDHFILLKRRNGSVESIPCEPTSRDRIVKLLFAPSELPYTGNHEENTEFSFGNEARLLGQLMLPQTIDSSSKYTTQITAMNYSPNFYKDDPVQPLQSGFDDGFDSGFF